LYAVPAPHGKSVWRSMQEGWRYVARTPTVSTVIVLLGTLCLFAMNTNVLVPLFAKNVLQVGAPGFGVLMSAMGVGSLVAAILAAIVQRPRWVLLIGAAVGLATFEFAFALSPSFHLSLVLIALMGFSWVTFSTSANTSVQQQAPDQLRGRVMGVYATVNVGIQPIGNLLTGALAGAFGAPLAMELGAGAALVSAAGVGGWLLTLRRRTDLSLRPHAVCERSDDRGADPPASQVFMPVPAHRR
jgi:predicted MFS family arabinose efflux permease